MLPTKPKADHLDEFMTRIGASLADFGADIKSFIDAHNEKPKPCKWVKSADEVLASVRGCCRTMTKLGESKKV